MKPIMVAKDSVTFRCHQPICLWSDGNRLKLVYKANTIPSGHEVRIYEWPWKVEVVEAIR